MKRARRIALYGYGGLMLFVVLSSVGAMVAHDAVSYWRTTVEQHSWHASFALATLPLVIAGLPALGYAIGRRGPIRLERIIRHDRG